jgi:diamine N-acetyltransferase
MILLENVAIRLRALEPEDLDILYKWENDTRLWKYGNTLRPYSRYELRQYLKNSCNNIYDAKQLRMIIEDKASKQPAGTIDLYNFDPFHNRAGIGILIDDSFQNKSYATQSILLMADYAFGFLKMSQMYALIPAMNIASLHLFRKCGFVESGLLKKWNKNLDRREDVFIYQLFNSHE